MSSYSRRDLRISGRAGGRGPASSSSSPSHYYSFSTVFLLLVASSVISFVGGSFFAMCLLQWEPDSRLNSIQQVIASAQQAQQAAVDAPSSSHSFDTNQLLSLPLQELKSYVNGISRVNKQEFVETFDMGIPSDHNDADDVLIVYQRPISLPQDKSLQDAIINGHLPRLDANTATESCDVLHMVLTDHSRRKQCLALVPQYESYHVQKWMRVSESHGGPVDKSHPLKMVSRGYQVNGRQQFLPPPLKDTQKLWDMLQKYITDLPKILDELEPILKAAAKRNRTVIVMVCNFGQSELLMNFICNAKAQQLDLSQVVVFATDQDTYDLVTGLGVKSFYDKTNFGDMPSEAANHYGDRRFTAMMMAKVFCVQMVTMSGYNVLFQDVDLVWFRNPLEYFHKEVDRRFDMFFQDDGAHSQRYAPYSANSGFYYVRNNPRTVHFFNALLLSGDMILKSDSHQQALIALVNEHTSLYGTRVKVLSRDMEEFPGGYHYHQKTGKYMRAYYRGEVHPIIFHMSWTENKNNKVLFFKQTGWWHVQEQCIAQRPADILSGADTQDLAAACCSAEPLISCHYRDKPSKNSCKDSPPIDPGKPSFW